MRPAPFPPGLDDDAFLARAGEALARLPGVQAVMLGGSRAAGRALPDSDWDFSIYYRGRFDVDAVRGLGWPGRVSEIGGWGGGVFNGGAWLEAAGRRVDVHYRDLDDVERRLGEARRGEFAIEPLLNYLAGVPTYIVAAELALGRVLSGSLERPEYPEALRREASRIWDERASMTLAYARNAYARRGKAAMACAAAVRALLEAAHARLARAGIWITNEKTLLEAAGWDGVDALHAPGGPEGLLAMIGRIEALIRAA